MLSVKLFLEKLGLVLTKVFLNIICFAETILLLRNDKGGRRDRLSKRARVESCLLQETIFMIEIEALRLGCLKRVEAIVILGEN